MPSTRPPRTWVLFTALGSGALALLFALVALAPKWGSSPEALVGWVAESARVLTLNDPTDPSEAEPPEASGVTPADEQAPSEGQEGIHTGLYAVALVFALLFVALGGVGLLLELSGAFRDGWRRLWFMGLRAIGRDVAVVIGLGWVGGPLAKRLRDNGRPVYGIGIDPESPRVAAAREAGVLVVIGDATEDAVRRRAGLRWAREVFVATGDDSRNVELAGDLHRDAREGGFGRRTKETRATCYVHLGNPSLQSTLRSHGLFASPTGTAPADAIRFEPFSNREIAARQLFYDPDHGLCRHSDIVPAPDEAFHLFLFGFGPMGQTVLLQTAAAAHFASRRRPRVTVFTDLGTSAGRANVIRFLDRHPALAPVGLEGSSPLDLTSFDLAGPDVLACRDSWASRPGHPRHPGYCHDVQRLVHKRDEVVVEEHADGVVSVRPVEFAASVEFRPLPSEVDAHEVVDALLARVSPRHSTPGRVDPVRTVAVMCFEEERRSFQASLQLQRALAHHAPDNAGSDGRPVLPMYVYLPVEEGLVELIDNRPPVDPSAGQAETESRYPLHVFGEQEEVVAPEAIVRGRTRRRARAIGDVHAVFAPGLRPAHPDFPASDRAAALHADVEFDAIGVRFYPKRLSPYEAWREGVCETPLLHDLICDEVVYDPAYRRLEVRERLRSDEENPPLRLRGGELGALPSRVRQRLSLLGRLYVPPPPTTREQQVDALRRDDREKFQAAIRKSAREAIRMFAKEVAEAGHDADLAAEIEHNRWMGERLAAGWRFGSRSNRRRQRVTFVPWADLDKEERHYDRAHLPRLILEVGPTWSDPRPGRETLSVKKREALYAYITLK